MKVPLKWLEDYVPLTLPVAELAERLTLAGLEVSGVRLIGVPPPEGLRVKSEEAGPVWDRDKIVVAQVVERREAPQRRQAQAADRGLRPGPHEEDGHRAPRT